MTEQPQVSRLSTNYYRTTNYTTNHVKLGHPTQINQVTDQERDNGADYFTANQKEDQRQKDEADQVATLFQTEQLLLSRPSNCFFSDQVTTHSQAKQL